MVTKESLFEQAVEQGEKEAACTLKASFDQNPNPLERLPYHCLAHSALLRDRSHCLLLAIHEIRPDLVSTRNVRFGGLLAMYHDIKMGWEPNLIDGPNGFRKILMKRYVGKNEKDSASDLKTYMFRINDRAGDWIFTEDEFDLVDKAMDATIPLWDEALGTVVQPNLKTDPRLNVLILGMMDLGSAGMDPQRFLGDGDACFREENLDIFLSLTGDFPIEKAMREYHRERMLNAVRNQGRFADGRREMYWSEVAGLDPEVQKEISRRSCHFDESREAVRVVLKKRESMDYGELAVDMGYLTDQRSSFINLATAA